MSKPFGNLIILTKRTSNIQHIGAGSQVPIPEAETFVILVILIVIGHRYLAVLFGVSE